MFDVGVGQASRCWLAEGGGRLPVIQPTEDVPAAQLALAPDEAAALDDDATRGDPAVDPIGEALDRVGSGSATTGSPGGARRPPDGPG